MVARAVLAAKQAQSGTEPGVTGAQRVTQPCTACASLACLAARLTKSARRHVATTRSNTTVCQPLSYAARCAPPEPDPSRVRYHAGRKTALLATPYCSDCSSLAGSAAGLGGTNLGSGRWAVNAGSNKNKAGDAAHTLLGSPSGASLRRARRRRRAPRRAWTVLPWRPAGWTRQTSVRSMRLCRRRRCPHRRPL